MKEFEHLSTGQISSCQSTLYLPYETQFAIVNLICFQTWGSSFYNDIIIDINSI